MMDEYKIKFSALPWASPLETVKYKAHEAMGRKIRIAEFDHEFCEHEWCEKGHIGYVIEGDLEIDFDGKLINFSPGDGIVIPEGSEHKHKARVLSDHVKLFLVEDSED